MEEEKKVTIKGKTYRLVGDGDECDRCALYLYCKNEYKNDKLIKTCFCEDEFGVDDAEGCRFEEVHDNDELTEELTEERAYEDYQERSAKSGDRAETLAWMMIALLFAQLVGSKHYHEFYIMGASAIAYMLLSVLQYVWQTLTMWLTKQRIKRDGEPLSDYPEWVGFGAWVFYWLKMSAITAGAVYGAYHFMQLL